MIYSVFVDDNVTDEPLVYAGEDPKYAMEMAQMLRNEEPATVRVWIELKRKK